MPSSRWQHAQTNVHIFPTASTAALRLFTAARQISRFITAIIINIRAWVMPCSSDKAAAQAGGREHNEVGKDNQTLFIRGPLWRCLKSVHPGRAGHKQLNPWFMAPVGGLFCSNIIFINIIVIVIIFVAHSSLTFWKSIMNTNEPPALQKGSFNLVVQHSWAFCKNRTLLNTQQSQVEFRGS